MSNTLKEYYMTLNIERDSNGVYMFDVYMPNENITVLLEDDVYLEFIRSSPSSVKSKSTSYDRYDGNPANDNYGETVKTTVDKSYDTTSITLVLKSKTKDIYNEEENIDVALGNRRVIRCF